MDVKLEAIKKLMFPPLTKEKEDGIEFYVDSTIDHALDAALTDISEGVIDGVTINTLQQVLSTLIQVRKILEVDDETKSLKNGDRLVIDHKYL